MGLSSGGLLLLLGGVALVLAAAGCSGSGQHSNNIISGVKGSSTHTLQYFKVAISEPGQGLPHFLIVGYLDDQLFVQYDTKTCKMLPQVPWVKKVELEDPGYWEKQTLLSQKWEHFFQDRLWPYHNHSKGIHIWQWTHGCQLNPDGSQEGHTQFGYDGRDFLSLDLQRLTWVGADATAQRAKKNWDSKVSWTMDRRHFVEVVCLEWLQKFMDYAKESLRRTERPIVRVTRKQGHGGQETLFCQLYGFYPKEIEVSWMKDGEDQKPETYTGGVIPNSDGTYHTWLSIEVDPKERDRYWCRVEHDGLLEPLDLAWEEPAPNLGLILGIAGGVLLVVAALVGVTVFLRNRKEKGYEIARSDQGSDTSTRVSVPEA